MNQLSMKFIIDDVKRESLLRVFTKGVAIF